MKSSIRSVSSMTTSIVMSVIMEVGAERGGARGWGARVSHRKRMSGWTHSHIFHPSTVCVLHIRGVFRLHHVRELHTNKYPGGKALSLASCFSPAPDSPSSQLIHSPSSQYIILMHRADTPWMTTRWRPRDCAYALSSSRRLTRMCC